jgi:minor histocompatibility antigen H13
LTKTSYAFPLSYLLVLLCWFVPQYYPVPYQVNLLLTTSSLIYLGSHLSLALRSPDQDGDGDGASEATGEVMTAADAMRFPFIGSAALFGLYCAFKYLDEGWVNYLISFYFTAAGGLAVATSFEPIVRAALPSGLLLSHKFKVKHPLPPGLVGESPLVFEVSTSGALALAGGALVGNSYFRTKHWTLNNVLGLAFCVQGISMFSIGSYKIAAILLVGLFFYDIFWVFGTPVMVTVAKKLDGPIKLLFPRSLEMNDDGKLNLSLLGLGDIVIPGFLVSFMLRFDANLARVPLAYNPSLSFPKPYFTCVLFSYVLGLGLTLFIMARFNAAQPALLYLVPATLGSTLALATARGELGELWSFSEEEEGEEDGEGEKQKVEKVMKKTPVKSKRA